MSSEGPVLTINHPRSQQRQDPNQTHHIVSNISLNLLRDVLPVSGTFNSWFLCRDSGHPNLPKDSEASQPKLFGTCCINNWSFPPSFTNWHKKPHSSWLNSCRKKKSRDLTTSFQGCFPNLPGASQVPHPSLTSSWV